MRLFRRHGKRWIADPMPTVSSGDFHTAVVMSSVWVGLALAIHWADSPGLYAIVDRLNKTLDPVVVSAASTSTIGDPDALVVTLDHAVELSATATLWPRGFHPVIATGSAAALERVHRSAAPWRLVVIDTAVPEAEGLARELSQNVPVANIVSVTGHQGAQVVSGALLDRLRAGDLAAK